MSVNALSDRGTELLERAYAYVLEHGLADLSLRPLAAAIGSSPRVLLFIFGSRDGLIRTILGKARADELAVLEGVGAKGGLAETAGRVWSWLADPDHRPVLALWAEAYARSLVEPDGAWAGFAQDTVTDWLALLAQAQPPQRRRSKAGRDERTAILALMRGALLDLLATGDRRRVNSAVRAALGVRLTSS